MSISAKFWGVRGSVPAPQPRTTDRRKHVQTVREALMSTALGRDNNCDRSVAAIERWIDENIRLYHGGNTTCVEVRAGDELIILDMGTGLRELGLSLLPETFKNGGIDLTILQSHVHWDHIQGYPFWPHVYMDRRRLQNHCRFYGGKNWDETLLAVLRNQMDPPRFPVPHGEIEETGLISEFMTVRDGLEPKIGAGGKVSVLCRKLFHPQETYGYRIETGGQVLTFCTDHEPYAAGVPDSLLELARDTDVFITDCQYTRHQYLGVDANGAPKGMKKLGWGHSFPEYIAEVARAAKVKRIVTTHHDPEADEYLVEDIAGQVQALSGIPTVAAYEGLTVGC